MSTIQLPTPLEGRRALDSLAPKLDAIREDAIARPHTDPHAAAMTALLVSDWLAHQSVPFDTAEASELGRMARAIITLVEQLGGDYLTDARAISPELVERGHAVRYATIEELEAALPSTTENRLWLEAVRRGDGAVDLVYDLRTLAELQDAHADRLPVELAKLPGLLRAAADAIEIALRADEPPELAAARVSLGRLWTLFVPAYEKAAAAGRAITREKGAEQSFPPLALIAAHQRARRRAGEADVERATPTPGRPDAVDGAPPMPRRSARPPAPATMESRRSPRAPVDLEVGIGIGSESNFYVGFTENLSAAGVFVATYVAPPIGSRVHIAVSMYDGEPMQIAGVVKWARTATNEGWPGVGVEFDALTPEQEKRIKKFLSVRDPLFYDG